MSPALEAKGVHVETTRPPECVDKVWDEQVDGAWAPGKAPVSLLTAFLKHVQEQEADAAERVALEILEVEPSNRLVEDLLAAMKQQKALEVEQDSEDEGDEDDSEEEEDEDDSENDDSEQEEEQEEECDQEAKNSEAK